MSLSRPRLLATLLALAASFAVAETALAAGRLDTWLMMKALPATLTTPVFALATSPSNPELVVTGTGDGGLYRSQDGGRSWTRVAAGIGNGVVALAFDPLEPSRVLAGTRAGIWQSMDGGATWARMPSSGNLTVRAFAFTLRATFAGTNQGVWINRGGGWAPDGLAGTDVAALAAAAESGAGTVLAGGDGSPQGGLPLFRTSDGGQTWAALHGPEGNSQIVATLAAGPVLPAGVRPVVLGTNDGAFLSNDAGQSWTTLPLPGVDFTAAAFVPGDPQRFYVASDGGGSESGGLWVTTNGGTSFASLNSPLPSVTALAVGLGPQPEVYAAAFRPIDQAVMTFSYADAGGSPQPVPGGLPGPRHATAPTTPTAAPANPSFLQDALTATELPYAAAGSLALFVLFLALFAYLLRGRPSRA